MTVKINPTSIKVSVKVFGISVNALLGDVTCVIKCRAYASSIIGLWRQVNMQQPRTYGVSVRDGSESLEIDRMRARFARISDVSLRIAEGSYLDSVLQEVVDGARFLIDARYGAVGLLDDSGQVRDLITSGMTPEEEPGIEGLLKGLKVFGHLSRSKQPLRLPELTQHPWPGHLPENHPPVGAFLGASIRHLAPIHRKDECGGVLRG